MFLDFPGGDYRGDLSLQESKKGGRNRKARPPPAQKTVIKQMFQADTDHKVVIWPSSTIGDERITYLIFIPDELF